MKNPLSGASPLPGLSPVDSSSPIQSVFQTIQSVLPNNLSTSLTEKRQSKKRVRFALKLETVQEDPSLFNNGKSLIGTTKTNKRIIDPWRDGGPLYGAYVEYLDKQGALTSNLPETHRPTRPSPPPLSLNKSDVESSTHTNTILGRNKSPEILTESVESGMPPLGLPHILNRTTATKKNKNINNNNNNNNNSNNRRPSLPAFDPSLKQRVQSISPSHNIQSKKISGSLNNKKQPPSIHPTVKRADVTLPSIKDNKFNEKLIRTDYSGGTKVVNEYCQSQKLTEIISNSLSNTNNQIYNLSEHSVPPNFPKTPRSPCQNYINNESYYSQKNNHDLLQPIIH
ncbi:unnamed protein product [Rotaria socialis]|uniref:Uncharacterized protein n=1 Tax=Rotaria socialis TaxID=392032 RepID=A0A817N6F6_9BILA|nr:unnamed protein product [Rotaria socialis]CAF4277267.1 unnamed protein product [Rotaria socialis]